MTPTLQATDLTVDLPTQSGPLHAVRTIGLTIAPGEMLCLVGESGSGKSITALSLIGLLPPGARFQARALRLLDQDVQANPGLVRGDRAAMIFQDPMTSLDPSYSIAAQMIEGLLHHRPTTSRQQARDRAAELLALCGVDDPQRRLGQYPHQLSGGQRQRVMIAAALMTEPALLIADEPTTALDVTIQAQILGLLARLRHQTSLSVLLITHDLAMVGRHADRVAVMYAGEIVEQANTAALFRRPMHPYTRALIACRPQPADCPRTPLAAIPGQVPSLVGPMTGCLFRARCNLAHAACAGAIPDQPMPEDGRYRCVIPPDARPDTAPRMALPASPRPNEAPPAATPPMLELRDVSVAYPAGGLLSRATIPALRNASLVVPRGATFGIVGESGSGKSTLSRLMLGLRPPSHGQIFLHGRPLAAYDRLSLARTVQPVFQDPSSSLNPRRAIGATVRLPLDLHRIGPAAGRHDAARAMLDRCGLPARLFGALPAQLSGGQKQRVALASALVLQPDLLICDEPTSALDVSIQAQILNLLLELQAEFGLTLVMISHDLAVIRHMADQVAVLRQGEIVEQGAAEALFRAPAHPYTRSLLAA